MVTELLKTLLSALRHTYHPRGMANTVRMRTTISPGCHCPGDRLCACVRYWPYHGDGTCVSVLIKVLQTIKGSSAREKLLLFESFFMGLNILVEMGIFLIVSTALESAQSRRPLPF